MLYQQAIELDPWLAIAYTNLGNIRFRRHDPEGAEALRRHEALRTRFPATGGTPRQELIPYRNAAMAEIRARRPRASSSVVARTVGPGNRERTVVSTTSSPR